MSLDSILADQEIRDELLHRLRTGSLPYLDEPLDELVLSRFLEIHQERTLDRIQLVADVIRDEGRPALIIQDGSIPAPELTIWQHRFEPRRAAIERAVASVGRLQLNSPPFTDFIGTGCLVRPGIVMTNRHIVLNHFGRMTANGPRFIDNFGPPLKVVIDFKGEYDNPEALRYSIQQILHIEPDEPGRPDLAFLRVTPHLPIEPFGNFAPVAENDEVMAIGYPGKDTLEALRQPRVIENTFRGLFDIKRASPGLVVRVDDGTFTHDASTTDGSSGSLMLGLKQEAIVGLHDEGTPLENRSISGPVIETLLSTLGL